MNDGGKIEMDADFEEEEGEGRKKKKKGKRGKKNERKKLKAGEDAEEEEEESVEDDFDEMDHEDVVGGIPTRFHYTPVPTQQSYDLTPAEILLATDAELNELTSLKRLAPYRIDEGRSQKKLKKRIELLRERLKGRKWGEGIDEEEGPERGEGKKRKREGDERQVQGEGKKKKRKGRNERKRGKAAEE